MKKIYLILAFFLVLSSSINAQTPTISIYNPELACLGVPSKIQVNITGDFKEDNKFTVQIRKIDTSPILAELPAVLKDGKIEVTYKDSTLSTYGNLQIKVVSSSPKAESGWYYSRINSKGTVRIGLAESDTINLGEDLLLKFSTYSSTEVYVTLNDSTKFNFSSYAEGTFDTYESIGGTRDTPFFIARASNSCGPMKISGQVKAVINPISVRTKMVAPISICEGNEIKIIYTALGPAFTSQTKFRVRFIEVPNYNNIPRKSVEVPAQLIDDAIVARFPDTFKITTYRAQFNAQILVDNPRIVGATGDVSFYVYPKPSAEFYTPSLTAEIGQAITVGVRFNGLPPYSADLGDGTEISGSYTGQTSIEVRPIKTTSYSIKSFQSGCGQTAVVTQQTMVVTVKDGIALDPESSPQIFCVGAPSKIRIKSNGKYDASTVYSVNFYFHDAKIKTFPATRNGDYLEFTVPPLPANTAPELSYDNVNSVYITSNSPKTTSQSVSNYVIQSMPSMALAEYNVYNYTNPGMIYLGYYLYGGGPFSIEDQNGKLSSLWSTGWSPVLYLNKTTDFRYKSISNSCFKNEDLISAHVTLTPSSIAGLFMEPLKAGICNTDSIEVTINTTGSFGADNIFNIQTYNGYSDFATVKTVNKAGTYRIKLPPSPYQTTSASIKVASTNPVLFSETYTVQVNYPLTDLRIDPMGTAEQPFQYLKTYDLQLSFNGTGGTITAATYSDGTTDKNVNFEVNPYTGSYNTVIVSPPVGKTTVFTLKSATNLCGTQPANVSTYIKALPYKIFISDIDYYSSTFCAGNAFIVPFGITDGKATNATFSLQLAKDVSNDFTTISDGETSRQFSIKLPADLGFGSYQMRIISSDGSVSNIVRFQVGSPPTATLTSNQPQPIQVNAGEYLPLTLTYTGSSPWTVIYENNTKQKSSYSPDSRNIIAGYGQEFSIKAVYNSCGYGTASGTVAVKVKPRLTTYSESYTVCEGGAINVTYSLLGDVDLSKDYIRFELIDVGTQKVTVLDSVKTFSGSLALKIPASLTGNYYQIRCSVRSYDLTAMINVGITTKADVVLSGNTTVNSGESAQILIRSTKTTSDAITYKLSDGSIGTFYGGSGNGKSFIKVNPAKTTTYTLSSVSNSCGPGKASGSAIVEVNPASDRTINVTSLSSITSSGLCTGDTVLVTYSSKGTFSATNVMSVQISDTTGKNFKSITTLGNKSPLKAVIPANLFFGKDYRVRVAASDAGTGSGAYEYPVNPSEKAKAKFASESVIYDGINNPKIVVLLEGGGPWQYDYGTDLTSQNRYSSQASDTIVLQQASPSQYYKLFRVYNQCGLGTIEFPGTVRVEVVTGEPAPILSKIIVAPNPASDFLLLKFETAAPRNVFIFNNRGMIIQTKLAKDQNENIDIRQFPSGIYLLQVDEKGRKATFKIIKQ